MCQFLLGTVQPDAAITFCHNPYCVSIPLRYGTTRKGETYYGVIIWKCSECQFLLGTVQQQSFPAIINIVLYFFQKFNHFSSKKSVDLFSCLTLIISI